MKTTQDLHMHTNWCDAQNTPEEMVQSAIQKGLQTVGILTHSYTWFDTAYCIPAEKIEPFCREIERLKEKYKDRIQVLCGVELDYYSDMDVSGFDYVIGSVHYVHPDEDYYAIDSDEEGFVRLAEEKYGGDYYALAEDYFRNVGDVIRATHGDQIGHFDLVSKYNRANKYFDPEDPRYVKAWQAAAEKLVPYGVPFEINTGCISRGYWDVPYPKKEMIEYIRGLGGSFVMGSDSHRADAIACEFEKWEYLLEGK